MSNVFGLESGQITYERGNVAIRSGDSINAGEGVEDNRFVALIQVCLVQRCAIEQNAVIAALADEISDIAGYLAVIDTSDVSREVPNVGIVCEDYLLPFARMESISGYAIHRRPISRQVIEVRPENYGRCGYGVGRVLLDLCTGEERETGDIMTTD